MSERQLDDERGLGVLEAFSSIGRYSKENMRVPVYSVGHTEPLDYVMPHKNNDTISIQIFKDGYRILIEMIAESITDIAIDEILTSGIKDKRFKVRIEEVK